MLTTNLLCGGGTRSTFTRLRRRGGRRRQEVPAQPEERVAVPQEGELAHAKFCSAEHIGVSLFGFADPGMPSEGGQKEDPV